MKPNRRGFLGVLGGTALGGRQAAEDAARRLAGINVGGGPSAPSVSLGQALRAGTDGGGVNSQKEVVFQQKWIDWNKLRNRAVEAALKDKNARGELESILYERYRSFHHLDPDLAYNKCYSMAAKLTYQRQRMVNRELDNGLEDNPEWTKINSWKEKLFDKLGLLKFLT